MSHLQAADTAHIDHSKDRQFRWINVALTLVMGLGSITYGYSASVISTTLIQPSFIKHMGLDTNPKANDLIGLTGSLFQVGGFCGTFTVAPISDRWGRRVGIAVPAVVTIIFAALLAASTNMTMFIAMRFFAGAAAYNIVCSVPLWMSEAAPPGVRGRLVDCHGALLLLGYASASWVGYAFYKLDSPNAWRGHQAVNAIPAALLLIFLYFMPESPRWLLMNDRHDEASKVLHRLHTKEEADIELFQIHNQVLVDRTLESSYLSLLKKPTYRKRVLLGCGTWTFIQFTGPLVLNNYGPKLYGALGYDADQQLTYQIGWLTLAFGAGCLATIFVEWFPRPKLMAFGIMFCVVCLSIEAALVATYATPEALQNPNSAALRAAVAMLYVYVAMWELALDGTQFVYVSELFPNHLRAKGLSLALAAFCMINIVWLQSAPTAFASIGWKFYLVFIIPGFCGAVTMWFTFPDTRGIPLEEVAAIFGDQGELYKPEATTAAIASTSPLDGKAADIEKSADYVHVEKLN